MKNMTKWMLGAAISAVASMTATSANATFITGQISLAGYAASVGSSGMGAASGVAFANAAGTAVIGSSGSITSFGAGTGSFASLGSCASTTIGCGTIKNIGSFASQGSLQNFITLTGGLAFDFRSVSQVSRPGGNQLSFTALGTLMLAGFDPTPGRFVFTAQGDNITSFSSILLADQVTSSVPEPATWGMMIAGFGMMGATTRTRRRSTKVSFA